MVISFPSSSSLSFLHFSKSKRESKAMRRRSLSFPFSFLLLFIFLFSSLQTPTFAVKKSYIVYLGGQTHGLNPTAYDLDRVTSSHYQLLGSCLGSIDKARDSIFYSYNRFINGFAAVLEEEEASQIARHPDVISVFLNKGRKLHTTRSWDFLGLERNRVISQVWKNGRFGEDTIIGNLDTGVWPESKSFNDKGYGPIPSRWRGTCQQGSKDYKVNCNRKLIGARYFNKGYFSYLRLLNQSFTPSSNLSTARDLEGHGTHTLSTAGGNFVPNANVFGQGRGTAKGGSPRARVAAYKVCWPPVSSGEECFDADVMAGFEAAISDGVDVISVSLGGESSEFSEDGIAIGAFHAVDKGIVVVSSAGNSGPVPGSVSNVAPWMITVGASTIDREFNAYVALGNRRHLKGSSLSAKGLPYQKFYPLITASTAKLRNSTDEDALLCKAGTLDPRKVKGRILVCLRGETGRVDKSLQALKAGAVGMILANSEEGGNEIIADTHLLAASHVNFTDGESVFSYIKSTKIPMAYMTRVKTEFDSKSAPFMASFSSRGPSLFESSILKPDITAPGVNILAAYSGAVGPSGEDFDTRRSAFNLESGTSMSCPHVSGIVGLLKTLHPHWSPAAIKSAIMTTAQTRGGNMHPISDSNNEQATPFAYGSGHVRPTRAADPGLVYDLTTDDYLTFLCARGYNRTTIKLFSNKPFLCPKSSSIANFNYPSITVPDLKDTVIITRRLKNVGTPGTYSVRVKAPYGISVSVVPSKLKFEKIGEEKKFLVVMKPKGSYKVKEFVFGTLIWSDGKHYVRSPLVVRVEL